jgi:hypothetical protein
MRNFDARNPSGYAGTTTKLRVSPYFYLLQTKRAEAEAPALVPNRPQL